MSVKVKVDSNVNITNKAKQAAERAVEIVMGELFAAMQQSFTAKAWDWPDDLPTRKLNGATLKEKIASYSAGDGIKAGNPRNLIDFGNLRQSGSYRMIGRFEAEMRWSAEYATAVHEGAYIRPWGNKKAARVYLPPRPWTKAVIGLESAPPIKVFPLGERLQNVWMAQMKR